MFTKLIDWLIKKNFLDIGSLLNSQANPLQLTYFQVILYKFVCRFPQKRFFFRKKKNWRLATIKKKKKRITPGLLRKVMIQQVYDRIQILAILWGGQTKSFNLYNGGFNTRKWNIGNSLYIHDNFNPLCLSGRNNRCFLCAEFFISQVIWQKKKMSDEWGVRKK